jgi:solute carrier family 10 (sodium/bile acid cotransporter), member 7
MIVTIKKQWFLISLMALFFLVCLDWTDILAGWGIYLKTHKAPSAMIFLIFIISGLLIEGRQVRAGLKDVTATLLALSVILVFAPVAAGLLSFIPMDTGIIVGLFIVSVMPSTLSSGIVMTGTAGGNMAHALFVTILSNFISIFSIPLILGLLLTFLNQEKIFVLDQKAMIVKLTFLVLLPLLIGIVVKLLFFKNDRIKKYKLQLVNQWLIVGIVFISLGGAKQVLMGKGIQVLLICALVVVFHLILLGVSFSLVKIFNVGKGRCESVIFMGSQKTLALALMLQVTYFPEFGMALVVCVIHHIVHLMMDGYLSTRMGNDHQ